MGVRNLIEDTGNAGMYCLVSVQVDEIMKYVQLGLSIIISIIILISRIVDWYQKAHADGKITSDEVKEGVGIIKEGLENINNTLDDKKKGDKK